MAESALGAAELFGVKGVVAVVTGGGTGEFLGVSFIRDFGAELMTI